MLKKHHSLMLPTIKRL